MSDLEAKQEEAGFYQQVHTWVRRVPAGKVVTYGQLARLAGRPRAARLVGWAMRAVTEGEPLPWYRVVNSSGQISLHNPAGAALQRALLEEEGIEFDLEGHVDLKRFGWQAEPA